MPKETISREVAYGEQEGPTPDSSHSLGTAYITTLEVGWDETTGTVEVVQHYEERAAQRRSRDHEVQIEPGESEHDRWIYSHLTRGQINHLIRALRRSRDRVFGRDE